MRPFVYTAVAVNVLLLFAGGVIAAREGIEFSVGLAVTVAFMIQFTAFLFAGFPLARKVAELALSPSRLAAGIMAVSLLPYLAYAPLGGVFSLRSVGVIAATVGLLAFWYVLFPAKGRGLLWQDVPFVLAIAYPVMMSRTFPILREIYASPEGVPRIDFLGKLMLFTLGALAILLIRRLPGTTYELVLRRIDWRGGLLYGALFLPIGIGLGLWLEYVRVGTDVVERQGVWGAAGLAIVSAVGIYVGVALPEELLFRGFLQNLLGSTLGSRWLALGVASLLFGLSHWPRQYPDGRFALLAGVAGIFYGLAYMRAKRIPEAALAHTLVVVVQRFGFN